MDKNKKVLLGWFSHGPGDIMLLVNQTAHYVRGCGENPHSLKERVLEGIVWSNPEEE